MELGLAGHAPEFDSRVLGEMTPLLDAGGVGREEAMGGPRVTGQALDLAFERRRIRFEMSSMPSRGSDGLPGLLGGTRHVAAFAGFAGDLGVRGDLLAPHPRHPEHHLEGFFDWPELVAGVAAQGVVLAFQLGNQGVVPGVGKDPRLPAGNKDVAAVAEAAVSLDEVVALVAKTDRQQDDEQNAPHHRGLKSPAPASNPSEDFFPLGPEPAKDQAQNYSCKHDAAPHDPWRLLEDPLNDGNDRVGQEGLVHDGIHGLAVDRTQ